MKKIIVMMLAVLVLSGCGAKKPPAPPVKAIAGIPLATVAAHRTADDCWLVINNNIYSLADFIAQHPDEEKNIAGHCGQDATAVFATWPMGTGKPHSDQARTVLDNYYIGDLAR